MVAVTTGARRLQGRAQRPDPTAYPLARRELSPSQELEEAKWALSGCSQRLQGDVDTLWVPVAVGVQVHPWRTLGLVVATGAAYGWIDDATHGSLSRLALRYLRSQLLGGGLR
ncbi:hypothetical protein [Guyparkeria halopsychrophila]|uniref:hypothetical protein n=1 Tax=Guyparkeria halopsychrophila TaxID=3139421 RepID=UPI0037C97DFA